MNGSVVIKEVVTKRGLKDFISFPYKLYAGNKFWIPPLRFDERRTLDKKKNPAFDYCEARYWLAYRNGEIVGRIAGILNKSYIKKWGNNYLRFGWIDFIDDAGVSKALLETIERWAGELGMKAVHGPLGFTDLDREGMLVEGFEELGTMATLYNYPYYPLHLEKFGYRKDADWFEFEIKTPARIPERVERMADIVRRRYNLKIVKAKKAKELLPYAKDMFHVLNDAFENLYGVVTLTERQIDFYVKQYFGFIRPEFVTLILDEKNKVAAFGISMPSLSKALLKCRGRIFPFGFIYLLRALKKNNVADLLLTAVRPDLQDKGLTALLMKEMGNAYSRHGIKKAESHPELEVNTKVQAFWKHFEVRKHKRRRCFIKFLQ